MSTHNIHFHREIRKFLCGYPLSSLAMGFEQNLFSQLPWLIMLLIFIKTILCSIADNVSTFSLKHFKCNINNVYTAQTKSSKTKISLVWNEKFTIGYQFYQLV